MTADNAAELTPLLARTSLFSQDDKGKKRKRDVYLAWQRLSGEADIERGGKRDGFSSWQWPDLGDGDECRISLNTNEKGVHTGYCKWC